MYGAKSADASSLAGAFLPVANCLLLRGYIEPRARLTHTHTHTVYSWPVSIWKVYKEEKLTRWYGRDLALWLLLARYVALSHNMCCVCIVYTPGERDFVSRETREVVQSAHSLFNQSNYENGMEVRARSRLISAPKRRRRRRRVLFPEFVLCCGFYVFEWK